MTLDRTILPRSPEGGPAEDEPMVTAASPILEQAKGFAQVARDAMNDCDRGEDAIRELHRRRNRSGQ